MTKAVTRNGLAIALCLFLSASQLTGCGSRTVVRPESERVFVGDTVTVMQPDEQIVRRWKGEMYSAGSNVYYSDDYHSKELVYKSFDFSRLRVTLLYEERKGERGYSLTKLRKTFIIDPRRVNDFELGGFGLRLVSVKRSTGRVTFKIIALPRLDGEKG